MISTMTGVRPSEVLEYEGSTLERILLDAEILSKAVERMKPAQSVKSQIQQKRSSPAWREALRKAYKEVRRYGRVAS